MRTLFDSGGTVAAGKALPRRNTNLAEVLNSEDVGAVGAPDALAPFHLASAPEKQRRIRDVLRLAWRLYRDGDVSMVDAISRVADNSPAGEYAKISLRRILLELNLSAWEAHPNRTRDDVHCLFRKAIGRLSPRRGGWRVAR